MYTLFVLLKDRIPREVFLELVSSMDRTFSPPLGTEVRLTFIDKPHCGRVFLLFSHVEEYYLDRLPEQRYLIVTTLALEYSPASRFSTLASHTSSSPAGAAQFSLTTVQLFPAGSLHPSTLLVQTRRSTFPPPLCRLRHLPFSRPIFFNKRNSPST